MGTVFEKGASGESVALLQEKLMELYYLPYGTPSAVYDEATEAAVMLFQQRNALPLTGIAGAATGAALRLVGQAYGVKTIGVVLRLDHRHA